MSLGFEYSSPQSLHHTTKVFTPFSISLPLIAISAYGFNIPDLHKMCNKVTPEVTTVSLYFLTTLLVTLIFPRVLG